MPPLILIVNRTPNKAHELAADFSAPGSICGAAFDDLPEQSSDLIINAASLQGEVPPLPDEVCTAITWCYDMMYGAEPTSFMRRAQQHGAKKIAGRFGYACGTGRRILPALAWYAAGNEIGNSGHPF